jgi:hypothetical protein
MMKAPPPEAPSASPLLAALEQRIETQLTPQMRTNYKKIVVAGMRAGIDGGTNGILYKLKDSKDPIHDCAVGAIGLVLMMRKQARGAMPMQALVPAAMVLMLKALGFAERSKLIPPLTSAILSRAVHIFTNTLFAAFKITPQMMQHAAAKTHEIIQDPVRMEKIKAHAGFTKVPPPPGRQVQPPPSPQGGIINGGM